MNGFLLNMINRHQGLIDKIQPRARSMFEPAPTSAITTENGYAGATDTMVKESVESGFQKQFLKSPILEKSAPENPPSMPLSGILPQAVQTDDGFRTYDPHSYDKNRMNLMNEQIQGLLARSGKKLELAKALNDPNGLQKPASPEATDQTAIIVVSNEQGLSSRIEETLGRLKKQTSNATEGKRGLPEYAQLSSANTIKIEGDQLVILPAQPETKGEQSAESHNKANNNQTQTVNTPNSLGGALQTPLWLTAMQTNLNNRLREINIHPQADPIINVTIGRVEVRAVNPEPIKPSAVQGKPKGVLSLDDYLMQRESKGRT